MRIPTGCGQSVLAADVVVGAVERPLQLREEVLGLVRGNIAAHVLAHRMVYTVVGGERDTKL